MASRRKIDPRDLAGRRRIGICCPDCERRPSHASVFVPAREELPRSYQRTCPYLGCRLKFLIVFYLDHDSYIQYRFERLGCQGGV